MTPRDMLRLRVGAFFRNTYGPGTERVCGTCRGPASPGREKCWQCAGHAVELEGSTCDSTLIFTYAQGDMRPAIHQSAHTVRAYKAPTEPVAKCAQDMRLTVAVGTDIHGECIATHLGDGWDSATYVPSSRGRTGKHPVGTIAAAVTQVSDPQRKVRKFLLEAGSPADPGTRSVDAGRFAVPAKYRGAVDGKHILLVDDTWTTGASIQSAAAALKAAGAASVTGLCVARWLKWSWSDHTELLETLTRQYEPNICPVDGTLCARALST